MPMRVEREIKNTPDIERLIALIGNKEVVLWAGSGLSLEAGYPSGAEFCDIICKAAKSENDKEILSKHKTVLMNIAMEFEQLYSRDELIGLVSTHFDKAPTKGLRAHYLCTQIPQIDTIITTNYDRLFEYVYGDRLNTVVGTQYKAHDKKPVTLYKIHGDSSDSASVVLTSKDYAKFYEGLDSLIWNKLKSILAEHSVLFIGYSLEDKNIEDIFEKVLSQVGTSKSDKSEFFIAVPTLAEHKLRHFNTICKTTHLPIKGETLLSLIERDIRENIVLDAIDKRISTDEAYSVAYKHGVQTSWNIVPNGEKTRIEVERYIVNPFSSLIFQGITINSSPETVNQMTRFLEDCDCHEMVLPPECVTLFENVNGINIPKNIAIGGTGATVFGIKKPEQVDEVILTVENHDIYKDSIVLRSFWGSKRKRETIQLSTISISLLFEGTSININLSFTDGRSAKETLDDLAIVDLWCKGNTLLFSKMLGNEMVAVLKMPPIEDAPVIEVLSNYVSKNNEIYSQTLKLESYLKTEFLLPKNLTYADKYAITKVLSAFETVEVEDTCWNSDLQLNCDRQLYEALKNQSSSSMKIIENAEEKIHVFGHEYIIQEQQITVPCPVIENTDEVRNALLSGKKPIAKIVSSTGKLMLRCKAKHISSI